MSIHKPSQPRTKVREPSGTAEASAWWHAWRLGHRIAWAALIVSLATLAWCQWT